jgi:hypothetical protein
LDRVKALVEYMRAAGVDAFKVGDIEVTFGIGPGPRVEEVTVTMTPEQREEELTRIKGRMTQIANSVDEDLFWSAPGS